MPEGGEFSTINPTRPVSSESGQEAPRSPKEPSRSSWSERLKSLGLKFLSEEPFKPENFSQRAVAQGIIDIATHPALKRMGRKPNEITITVRDYLSNKGHVRDMDNANSPAFRAARQAFSALARDQRIGVLDLSKPSHGEWSAYYIDEDDIEPLKEFIKSPEEQE